MKRLMIGVVCAALLIALVPSTWAHPGKTEEYNCRQERVYTTGTCERTTYTYECRYVETDRSCSHVCKWWPTGTKSYSCPVWTGETKRVCDTRYKHTPHGGGGTTVLSNGCLTSTILGCFGEA